MKILMIFGTRPEAIKMCHLANELKKSEKIDLKVCSTSQHKEMLSQVLKIFNLIPDYDLDVMKHDQSLNELFSNVLQETSKVYEHLKPDMVLVHGDTTTALASTLAAYHLKIDVGHIEAGLRTYNNYSPWPEEINRRLIASISKYNFAPTEQAKKNLVKEGIKRSSIIVTGNTVTDAVRIIEKKYLRDGMVFDELEKKFNFLDEGKKLILITGHRRESFGKGLENMCFAIKDIACEFTDIEFIYPVHLNPNVKNTVQELLSDQKNIHIVEPVDYVSLLYLIKRSYLVLTDSGGIQEEAPSFRKPVLVTRDYTERTESIEAGSSLLVGTDQAKIKENVKKLLSDQKAYEAMCETDNPFGDGHAVEKIVKVLAN